MNDEQFDSEKQYYLSVSIAKSMLEKGVIGEATFDVIHTKLFDKYKPVSATLLSGKPLT